MSLSDCKINYEAAAVLHERETVRDARKVRGGGPISNGSLAEMIREAMASPERFGNISISVDGVGDGWLEIAEIKEIFRRSDFPQ